MDKTREAVKNIIVALLIGFAIFMSVTKEDTTTQLYQVSAEVTSTQSEVQQLTDTRGNVWEVENEDLAMYGKYIITLDNQGTSNVIDDVIVKIE